MVSAQEGMILGGPTYIKGKVQIVGQNDFAVSVNPSSLTVNAGSSVQTTVTITSFGGFNSAVSLTASMPGAAGNGVSFGFSPSTVTPPAGGIATSTLTVSTTGAAGPTVCGQGSSPALGTFTVTGTSGNISHFFQPCITINTTTYVLNITVNGSGSVTSSPGTINCPGTCSNTYSSGTNVTLTESPSSGWTFSSWGGNCSGTGTTTAITMNADETCTATWTQNQGARTDNCVTGSESGCTSNCSGGLGTGAPTCVPGKTGAPLAFRGENSSSGAPTQNQPYWAIPFPAGTNNAPALANSSGTDVDFNAYMVMATDQFLGETGGFGTYPWVQSWSTADGGDYDWFSWDNSLMFANNQHGGTAIIWINSSVLKAHQCSPANVCFYYTGIRTGTPGTTKMDGNGAQNWSRNTNTPANTFFELDGSDAGLAGTAIWKVQVCGPDNPAGTHHCLSSDVQTCATTSPANCTLVRTPYVQFSYSGAQPFGGVSCSVQAPAGGNDRVANEILPTDYIMGWHGNFNTANDDSVAFTEAGAGQWHASTAYTYPDSFVLHTISKQRHCVFQALNSGTSGAGPNDPWNGISSCPSVGTTYPNDGNITWRAIGASNGSANNNFDSQGPGFDELSYSPSVGCSRLNTRLPKIYRGLSNSAPGGWPLVDNWQACTNLANSGATSYTYPDGTTWNSTNTCGGSPGACQCGNLDHFTIHDGGQRISSSYAGVAPTSANNPAGDFANGPFTGTNSSGQGINDQRYFWQINSLYWRPCLQSQGAASHCAGHPAEAFSYSYSDSQFYSHSYNNPNTFTGAANPGTALLGVALSTDLHGSARNQNPPDTLPVILATTQVAGQGRRNNTGTLCGANNLGSWCALYYDEEVGASPAGYLVQSPFRYAHNWNTGSSPIFDSQNAMGVVSYDGTLEVITTDMMGRRGTTSNPWVAKATYTAGNTINPCNNTRCILASGGVFPSNNTNTGNYSYQWQPATPANPAPTDGSGTTEPNWGSCQSVGSTCTESSCTGTGCTNIVWTNVGAPCNNLRGDTQPTQNGYTYYVGDQIMAVNGKWANYVFQSSCPLGGGSCVNGTNFNFDQCPAYGACVNGSGQNILDGNVLWSNMGQNDCRNDLVVIDLTSPHG